MTVPITEPIKPPKKFSNILDFLTMVFSFFSFLKSDESTTFKR